MFIAVCLGLIALELGLIVGGLLYTLCKVNRAVSAVEVLTYRVEDEVEQFGSSMRSGWARALQTTASFAGAWLKR